MIRTGSQQIEVTISSVNREIGAVNGTKANKRLGGWAPFSVYFRDGEPVRVDGAGRPHPKLVLAAAQAAWRNFQAPLDSSRTIPA
jgi:hypothetical protein